MNSSYKRHQSYNDHPALFILGIFLNKLEQK